jgi:hypothetical protein
MVLMARVEEPPAGASNASTAKDVESEPKEATAADKPQGDGLVDVMAWLGRATLDVIGLAGTPALPPQSLIRRYTRWAIVTSVPRTGFNYDFGALKQEADQEENELADAFKKMFKSTTQITFLGILASFVPFPFALIPTEPKRRIEASLRVMNRVGGGIIEKAKAAIAREVDGQGEKAVTKSDVEGRDVISMLSASAWPWSKLRRDWLTSAPVSRLMIVRANMASDVAASQKLTDAEVLAQVTTFMCVPFHAFGGCARFDVPAYPS